MRFILIMKYNEKLSNPSHSGLQEKKEGSRAEAGGLIAPPYQSLGDSTA
jgi:hypothetical protein